MSMAINEKGTGFFRCDSQLMIHAVDMVSPAFDAGSSKNHRLEKSNYPSIIWVESTSMDGAVLYKAFTPFHFRHSSSHSLLQRTI